MPVIGRIGFAALLRRALHLARETCSALAVLVGDETGERAFTGGVAFASAHVDDPCLVEAGFVALLAHVVWLLDTFIGVPLTRRVLDGSMSPPLNSLSSPIVGAASRKRE